MNQYIKYLLGVAFICAATSMQAQQLPVMNHYIYNPYLYNPARVGQNDLGSVSAHFKKQWVAMPYSPFTAAVSVETPINTKKLGNMGVGGMLYTEQMHIINKVGGMASYAYHIPFSKDKKRKHRLGVGISLGFINQRFDFPSAVVEDENDNQLLPSAANGTAFDFSAGLDYHFGQLHVGASMLQGLNNGLKFINVDGNDVAYINTRHFMLNASYRFLLGPEEKKNRFFVEPQFLGRIITGLPFQAEGNVLFGVQNLAWLGLGFRSSNMETSTSAISITAGVEIKKRFVFAYTAELGVDANLNASLGSQHEFMLAFRFGKSDDTERILLQMDSMQRDITRLQNKDVDFQEQLNEMSERMDSVYVRVDSLERIVETQGGDNEKLKEQMSEYEKLLNDYGDRITNNEKEIEKLWKMLEDKPLKYKKIGEVYFAIGASDMSKDIKVGLDAVKTALDEYPEPVNLFLYGSASTDGDAKKNMELSMRRAVIVRKYLLHVKANVKKINIIPMGDSNPVSGDDSKVESKDRRVDIIVSQD